MKPEAQRIAIAEAMGWKVVPDRYYMDRIALERGNDRIASCDIPDYLSDLNAMHEAEKTILGTNKWIQYVYALEKAVVNSDRCHANAAKRAEAFLKTIGKWTE